jgi:hypothetical protein
MSNSVLRQFPTPPAPQSLAEQIAQLQADARELAADSIAAFITDLDALSARCAEAASCTVYAPGEREELRQAGEDMRAHAMRLTAINQRSKL